MSKVVFWISLLLLLYTFIGYPLILKIFAALRRRYPSLNDGFHPPVSVVLSVYNEEDVIAEKIKNFERIDYPGDKLELIIISDKCSDRTDEIIRSYESDRIRLIIQAERSGKTKNLNRGVAAANGDILVFTDANSMFDTDAIKKLVRNFFDPSIGLVSGKSIYLDPETGKTTTGGAYRRYEDFIKGCESVVVSIVGADGAIYAMRKALYEPLKSEYINDFIHTIQVTLKGFRAVSDDEAICREVAAETGNGEFRRQTRIMAQSWLVFLSQIGKLLSSGSFSYAWALVSHKFMRWITIPLMLILLVSSIASLGAGTFFQVIFVFEVLFILLIVCGGKLKNGISRVAYLFTLLHIAAMFGLYKYLSGNMYTIWNPRNN